MNQRIYALGLCLLALGGCAPQEPAAAALDAPPPPPTEPMTVAPPPGEPGVPAAPSTAELGPAQSVQVYQECWAAFNARDFARLSACFADNALSENVDSGQPPLLGSAIVEKNAKVMALAFPDLTAEAQLTLANGNTVVGVWFIRGTHQGALPTPHGTLAPTNRKIGHLLGHVVELQAGKNVKELSYADPRTVLVQLGVLPGPTRKPAAPGSAARPVVVATGSPTEKANLETYKRYLEACNEHDALQTEAFLADDFVLSDQSAPADLVGRKEVVKGYKELWKGASDLAIANESAWAAGDYVVTQSTFSGTNDGPLPSMRIWRKTGKPFRLAFLEITKLEDGKLKQQWVLSNGLAFAAQLGLLPPVKAQKPAGVAKPAAAPAPSVAAPAPSAAPPAQAAPPQPAKAAAPGAPPAMK